jgi:hypothetical protein
MRRVCQKLAIAKNRSTESMGQDLEHERSAGLSDKGHYLLRFLQRVPITPPGQEFFLQLTKSNVPNDMLCIPAIPFPRIRQSSRARVLVPGLRTCVEALVSE